MIFEFRVIWDQMSKCPKWVDYRLIWAIFVIFRPDNARFVIFEFRVIWDQMSKCLKWVDYRLIWSIFVVFRHDNARFLIFDFWVIWDQMSKCPKMGRLSSYLSNFMVFRHDIARFVGYPEKFWQKIWDESKKLCSETITHLWSNIRIFKTYALPPQSDHLQCFWHDHTRFVISEFWVGPQPAVWDLQKSFGRKSETNQKKSCSETSTHLRSNVEIFKICILYTYPRDLWHFQYDNARFEIWEFSVRPQASVQDL